MGKLCICPYGDCRSIHYFPSGQPSYYCNGCPARLGVGRGNYFWVVTPDEDDYDITARIYCDGCSRRAGFNLEFAGITKKLLKPL